MSYVNSVEVWCVEHGVSSFMSRVRLYETWWYDAETRLLVVGLSCMVVSSVLGQEDNSLAGWTASLV